MNTGRLPENPASASTAVLRGLLSREVHLWVSRVAFLCLFPDVRDRNPGTRVVRIFVPSLFMMNPLGRAPRAKAEKVEIPNVQSNVRQAC